MRKNLIILSIVVIIVSSAFFAIPKMPGIDNSDPKAVMSLLDKVYGIKVDSNYKVDDGYEYMSKSMVKTGKSTFDYTMTLNFDNELASGSFTAYTPKDPDGMMPYIAGLFAPEGLEDEVEDFIKEAVNSSEKELTETFGDAKYTIYNTPYVTLMYIEDKDFEAYCEKILNLK